MAAVSFVAALFVVRNLGPGEYGLLQEITAYFIVLQNFENLLNPNLFKKQLIESPEETRSLVATHGLVVAGIGLIFTMVTLAAYFALDLPAHFIFLPIMLAGVIFRCSNGISFYFDAKLETVRGQISLNVGNTLSSIYKVAASFLNPVALLQAFAVPLQYCLTALVHVFQYSRHRPSGPTAISFPKYWILVIASFPLFLSTFVDILKDRLSFIYLGSITTPVDLGLYGAGVKLTEPWLFVASALCISFWPKLVRTRNEDRAKYDEALMLFFSAIFYIFATLAVGGFLLSGFFVGTILGPKYSGSQIVFEIQVFVLLFQALNVALSLVEINQGLAKISLIRNGLSVLVVMGALTTLVPNMGIAGASYAMLIANAFACVVAPLFFASTRHIVLQMLKSPLVGPKLFYRYVRNVR